jgi:hypothetical protein
LVWLRAVAVVEAADADAAALSSLLLLLQR